jgi:hypothetical protein
MKNNTWELIPFPKGRKPISTKWVFRIKRNVIREINKYKARLVPKGFFQIHGINFEKTLSL